MRPATRDRLLLPILLPLGILALLGLSLWGFSRVLLGIHGSPATAVALVVAGAIVGVSALAASRPQVRASTIGAMVGATAGIAMLAGGIALAVVAGEEGDEGPEGPGGGTLTVVAQGLAFDTDTIELPADTPVTITFENRDSEPHNIAIYADDSLGENLFPGEIITGPGATVVYEIPPLPPGEYYFQCDVHPNMNGRVVVRAGGGDGGGGPGEDGGGHGEGGGGPGAAVTVSAENIAFDTDTIELPADAPSTITFDNREAVPHNIAIYADDSLGEVLFQGEIITGPTTVDYPIPPLPPGEYYFHCDVHPNMNGRVIVGGGG